VEHDRARCEEHMTWNESNRALAALVASVVVGCGGSVGEGESGSGRGLPFFPAPASTAPPPAAPNGPAMTMSEVMPSPPLGTGMNTPAVPAPSLNDPELTAAERAELDSMDGLVRAADWKAGVSSLITETRVGRAYLDWKERFFKSCDDGSVYVLKNDYRGTEEVASEGIAYGMLLSVAIGDKPAFDGLWQYYRERRNGNGVMNWLHAPCGGEIGGNGASDADLDAAMALLLADSRYGGYREDAAALIAAVGTHETQVCGDGRIVLKPGDAWGGCDGTVNPSYFSPAYYRRFALVQTDRADFWNQFTADTYAMLSRMQDQKEGLLPDWGFGNGDSEGGDRGIFGYEAVRAPWRIVLDLAWSGAAEPRQFLARMSQTVDARGGIAEMADDESFADKRNSAFLGSLSLSGFRRQQRKARRLRARMGDVRDARRPVVLSSDPACPLPDGRRRLLPRRILSASRAKRGYLRGSASLAPGPSRVPHIVLHRASRSAHSHLPSAPSFSFSRISLVSKRAKRSTSPNDMPRAICLGVRGSVALPSVSLQQRKPR
jgi:endo-1,4-beta-D-glucanase Y